MDFHLELLQILNCLFTDMKLDGVQVVGRGLRVDIGNNRVKRNEVITLDIERNGALPELEMDVGCEDEAVSRPAELEHPELFTLHDDGRSFLRNVSVPGGEVGLLRMGGQSKNQPHCTKYLLQTRFFSLRASVTHT